MLNNKLSNDKAFSFGKSSAAAIDQKTNDFKADSGDKSNQRGRNLTKKNENNQSGGVLLTFGLDRENLQRTKHYYTPPHDSRSGGNIGSTLYGKKNKNIESQIENKTNNYNTDKDSEKNQDNFKLKTNANLPPVNNFYLKNADKLINTKDCNNSTSNQNSNVNSPLRNNEANSSRNNLGLNNNGKKKVVINESNNVYNTLNEKREKSWGYPERTLKNNYNTNSQKNLNKNNSKINLNALNTNNKSFSQEQYSEYMKIKNNGLVRDLSQTTLGNQNERSASPFLKLKEKLSDNFMHFLKKHRFSAVMVGNSLFQGKTGNFYINMKNNKDDLQNFNPEILNNSNLLNTLENSQARDKQDKGLNDRESKCQNDSLNQSINQSLDESGKKIFDEKTKDYINSNSINCQNKNISDNSLINTNSKSSFNPADGNTKLLFDPNHIQENYKNYKESLNNNKLDDTLNFNTNQTEEKNKEDFNMQNKNSSNLNKKEELKSSSYSKMPAIYQNQLNSNSKKSSVDVNANKSDLYNVSLNKKNAKNPTPSISSYGNNAAKLAQNSTKKPMGNTNNSSLNSTLGGSKLNSTTCNNNIIKVNNVRNSNPAVSKLNNNNNIKNIQNTTNSKGSTQNLNAKSNFSNRKGSMGKVPDSTATQKTANKKENLLINKSNLMTESEKKSNSQSKISKDAYDKYSNYYLNQKSNKSNDKSNNETQLNNLNNSNLSNGTSMRSSSNRTIIYNPSSSNLAVESRNNEALNKTRSRNNLNSTGKNLEHSRSGNNFNTLQNENNVNNNNYINTNSNSNNYYHLLNTSTHKLANSTSTKKLNNGALRPEEILSYEAFKNLERIISLQKGFVDLTPIPMKKEDLKNRVDQIEYSAAERAAVLIRRMEYSHNLKNSKVELSENETKEFYLKLLIEAKTIIIQRWWRKMLKRLCIYHIASQRIQTAFRGYMFREAFRFAFRNTKVVFPFITKVIDIMRRNMLTPPFNLMRRLYKDQTHFEFVVKQIYKIQRAFRGFSKRRAYRSSLLKGICLAKHFNSLKFYFEKLKLNISLLKKVTLLQSRARGMNTRNPRLFGEKELEELKSFEESKDKKYEEVNNTILNNRNIFGNTNNNNSSNSNSNSNSNNNSNNNSKNHSPNKYAEDPNVSNYRNNILGRKTYNDIGLRINSRHRSSILKMIKDEKYIRYSPLLMSYLSCQRLHNCRRLGYREYQMQKFYLTKFVEKVSEKYLRRKKANQMRIRNNAMGYMLYVREKILKNFYFKKYRKVSESLGKLGRKALLLMKTTLRIFVWSKFIQKINRKILKHAAFKCVKNYLKRIQLNVLRKKFQVLKINATQRGKQILKLHQLSDKFNKKNAKEFFEKFKSLYKLTPKKLQTYERIFQAVKILNKFLTKKAFNSIKFIQFMKMKRFVGFVTEKILVPKALKYKSLAFEKIMMKNLDTKKKLEKVKFGFDLLHKYQKKLYQKVFENIKQKIRNMEHRKYIEDNYKLKNSNMDAKEKYSYAKTFEILEKILTRKERNFLQTLKKIGISNKFFNSGVKIIYRILSKKLLEYSYYFFSRLTSKQIFKHFNGILKSKEFEENNLNKIKKANQILNNFILKKGKKANFDKLKKFVMTKDKMESENKLKLKNHLLRDLFMKKIEQNFNLKKLYFYKLFRIVRGINYSEYADVFSGLAAFILNKIKKMKLKSLLEKCANKVRKQKLAEIKSVFNAIDKECYVVSQNGKKKFVNKKGVKFMGYDEVENKIRNKLILLGSKFDKKFIFQKYFDKLKLNKINDLNKIKKIQNCFRKQNKKAEAKKCLIKKLFEKLLFKYQKMKEKYFYKFANEIIAKRHKRSATTLRDFMRNYTLAAKKRRLLLKLLNQKHEDYNLILLEKFHKFKGSNCLIYYSHKKGLAGRKFEIGNSSTISNFNDNYYDDDNENEKNSNLKDEEDNNYNIDKTYKPSISMEETNPSSNFGLDTNNNDKKRRSVSKSLLVKSDNRRSNFKNKNDVNFGNDSKNSSDKNKRITLILDKNGKGNFPSIIQGGSDEEYDSQDDQKKDVKGRSNGRLQILNEESDDNKSSKNNEDENDYNNTRFNMNNNRFIKHTSPNQNNNSNRIDEHNDDTENDLSSNGNLNKIRNYNTKKVEDNNKTDSNKNDNDFDDQQKDKKLHINGNNKNIDNNDENTDLYYNDDDSYDQQNEKNLNVKGAYKHIDTDNNKTELNDDYNDSDDQKNEKKLNINKTTKNIETNNNKNQLNNNDNDSDDQQNEKKLNINKTTKNIDYDNSKNYLNENDNDPDDQRNEKNLNVKGTNIDIDINNNNTDSNNDLIDSDDHKNGKIINVKGTNKVIDTDNIKNELNDDYNHPSDQNNEKKFKLDRLAKNTNTDNNKNELNDDYNHPSDQNNEKKFKVDRLAKNIDSNNNKTDFNDDYNDPNYQQNEKNFNVKGTNKHIDINNNKNDLNENDNDPDNQQNGKILNVKGTNKHIDINNNKPGLNDDFIDSDDHKKDKKLNINGRTKNIDIDNNDKNKHNEKNTKKLSIRGKNQIIKIDDLNNEKNKIESSAIFQNFSPINNSEGNEDNANDEGNRHFVKNLKIRSKSSIVISDQEKLNELKEKIDLNKTNDPEEDGKTGDNQLNILKNNLLPVKDSTNENENENENGNEVKIDNIKNNASNKNFSKLNKVTESDLEMKNQNINKNNKPIENENDQKAAEQRNSRFNFSNLYSRKSVNESKSADTAADEQNKQLKTLKTASNLLKQTLNDDSNSDNKDQKNSNSSGHYHYDKKTNSDNENLNEDKIKNVQVNKINNILNKRSSNISDNPSRKSSNNKFSTSNLRQFNKINTSLRKNEYSDNVENEDFEEKENQTSENSDKNINNNDLNNIKNSDNRSKTKYEIKSNLFRKDKNNEKNNSSKNLKKNNNNNNEKDAEIFNEEEHGKENFDDVEEHYTNQRVLNQKRTQGYSIDNDSHYNKSKNDQSSNGNENDFKNVNAKNTFKKYTEETSYKNAPKKDFNNRGDDENSQEDLVNQDNDYTNFGNRILKQSRTYKKATTKDVNTDYNKSNFDNEQNKNENKPDENDSNLTDKNNQIYKKTENNIKICSLKAKHDKTADEASSDFIGKNDPKDNNSNNNNQINKLVLKNKYTDKIDNDVFDNIQNKKPSSNSYDCPTAGNEINKLNNYLKINKDKDINHEELNDNNTPNYENFMIDLSQNNSNSLRDMLRKLSDSHSIEGKFNTNNDNEFCDDLFDTKTKNTFTNLTNKIRKNSSNINNANNNYKSVSTNIVTDVTNINTSKITPNAYGSQVNNFEKSDEENTDNYENGKHLNNLLIKDNKSNEEIVGNDNDIGNSVPKNLNINNLNNKLIPELTESKKKTTLEKEMNENQDDEEAKELKGKSTISLEINGEEPSANSNSKNLKINSNSRINNINDNVNKNDSNYKNNNKINKKPENTNTNEGNEYSRDVVEIENIKKKVLTIKKFKKSGDDCDSNPEPNEDEALENMGEPDHDEEQVLKLNAKRLRDDLLAKTPTKEIEEEEIEKKNMLKIYIKKLSFKNDNNNAIDKSNNLYKKNDNNDPEATRLSDNREKVKDKSFDRNDDKNEDNKKEETKRDDTSNEDSSNAKYFNSKNLLKQENFLDENEMGREGEEVIDESEYPGLVHDRSSKEVSPTENSIKRSTIKEKRRSFNEFIIRKEKLKMLILKQTDKKFNEYSKMKFYQFRDKTKLSLVEDTKNVKNNLKNNKNDRSINNEDKEEARRTLFDMFNFYYRKTEITDIVMFLRVLKRDSSISKIQKFWRRKSVLLKERKFKNLFIKRIIAKEVIMNRALYNSFDKWLEKVQKISENIVRLTKFRRLQNLLYRFSKDIVMNVLIKTLSSKKIEVYEQVC